MSTTMFGGICRGVLGIIIFCHIRQINTIALPAGPNGQLAGKLPPHQAQSRSLADVAPAKPPYSPVAGPPSYPPSGPPYPPGPSSGPPSYPLGPSPVPRPPGPPPGPSYGRSPPSYNSYLPVGPPKKSSYGGPSAASYGQPSGYGYGQAGKYSGGGGCGGGYGNVGGCCGNGGVETSDHCYRRVADCIIVNAQPYERHSSISLEECKGFCTSSIGSTTTSFPCRSFVYDHVNMICDLFSHVGNLPPSKLISCAGRSYYETTGDPNCGKATTISTPSTSAVPTIITTQELTPAPTVPTSAPAVAPCPTGQVARYMRVPQYQSAGGNSVGQSQGSSVQSCIDACEKGQTDNGQSFTCKSFDFNNGQCTFYDSSPPPAGMASGLTPNAGTTHVDVLCLDSGVAQNCPGPYERYPQMVLVGYAEVVTDARDFNDCFQKCLTSQSTFSIQCNSAEFYYKESINNCLLNTETKNNHPDLFGKDAKNTVDYFELNCQGGGGGGGGATGAGSASGTGPAGPAGPTGPSDTGGVGGGGGSSGSIAEGTTTTEGGFLAENTSPITEGGIITESGPSIETSTISARGGRFSLLRSRKGKKPSDALLLHTRNDVDDISLVRNDKLAHGKRPEQPGNGQWTEWSSCDRRKDGRRIRYRQCGKTNLKECPFQSEWCNTKGNNTSISHTPGKV